MPEPISDMNRSQEIGYFSDGNNFFCSSSNSSSEEPLDINLRNLENLSLMDNFSSAAHSLSRIENNENHVYFQDFESVLNPYIDDLKEGNISRTVRVPSSEHVAEIVGRQGCKIKDLRARTNTYIKTPMRTQSPVFVVTGKEEAVLQVIEEIQNAAEHFTHIRASRNHHKPGGGPDANKPVSREGDVMIQVTVPYRVVGLVVGLKGQTIKAIQQDTDTFIVTPNRDKAPIFEIRGQPENVERARTMILRHIETRTRHCRLQDTASLSTNWSEEQKYNGNDYSFFNSDTLLQNGHNSSGTSVHNSFGNDNGLNGISSHGPNFNNIFSSTSPPAHSNYNWRGYTTGHDQVAAPNGHMTNWSSVTSDYTPMLCSTPSLPSRSNNLMNSARVGNSFPYSMSAGSISSSSNSSASISPPHEFDENAFPGQQTHYPFRASTSSLSLRDLKDPNEPSAFARFPLLSTAPVISSKGSLVLGNLFQSARNISSDLGTPMSCTTDSLNTCAIGLLAEKNEELNGFVGSLNSTSLGLFPGALIRDVSPFTTQINPFQSLDSSPAKSCSLSETSESQSSPIPRVCKICEEADVVAALVPCGHNLFCMECAEVIVNKPLESERKCPACKDTAADVLRIRA